MKYLKIAALFSLINAIFFGVFLYILYSQNIRLESQNFTTPGIEQVATILPDIATTTKAAPATFSATIKEVIPTPGQNQAPAPKTPQATNPDQVSPPPVVSNRCIVIVKGQRYDVTDFRSQHSGGDIFVCGTDMTQTFFGQHDQQFLDGSRMASLKVR